jgi:tRNA (cmo5U34)-methyltransferase
LYAQNPVLPALDYPLDLIYDLRMGGGQLGSWQSADYVGRWAGDDVMAALLETPRRISAALVVDDAASVTHVVDVGAGEGPYLAEMLRTFDGARGTWLDSSEPMLERAQEALAEFGSRVRFVLGPAEELAHAGIAPADLVVSSRALHHLRPDDLARAYREVRELLTPGGWFFNLDHVGADAGWEQRYRRIRHLFTGKRRQALRPHREDAPLQPLSAHVRLLEQAGFSAVDVPWRMLYTALIAARA